MLPYVLYKSAIDDCHKLWQKAFVIWVMGLVGLLEFALYAALVDLSMSTIGG
jgi:hypothetical protein